jgi:ubiquitin-activating enzyme E1-like protein 2
VGGIVAQEVVKAITQKFKPITQEIYLDLVELYQGSASLGEPKQDRLISIVTCLGDEFVERM